MGHHDGDHRRCRTLRLIGFVERLEGGDLRNRGFHGGEQLVEDRSHSPIIGRTGPCPVERGRARIRPWSRVGGGFGGSHDDLRG